jgi:transposase
VRRGLAQRLEQLPSRVAAALKDLLTHVRVLDERIGAYDRELQQHARSEPNAQRIQQLSGIGPITASAIVASVGAAREFRNGRQFAAWLGLTPRQYSSGGKTRLGHITRRGDPYLRTLLIMGARAVLQAAARHIDRLSRWALALKARRGYHRTCVAIAAKNARILWVLLARGETLRMA